MSSKQADLFPTGLIERGFLPVVFSHAAAVLAATVLGTLGLSQASCFTLFLIFVSCSLAAVSFYHKLEVTAAGKAVLLTGCDSRLGATLARQLDELGFTVFAGCLRPKCEEAESLRSAGSGRLHVIPLDVTSEQQVQAALGYVSQHLPVGSSGLWCRAIGRPCGRAAGLWAVVHVATWAAFGEVEWAPLSAFQRSAEVNLIGAVRVTQACLPQLKATKGRVISVVSLLGRVAHPARAPYCAAKFAVEAMSDCLRLEMRRCGVDVVVVEPGDALTGCVEWFSEERVVRQAREAWSVMSPDQKAEYGQDHFVNTVRAVHDYTKNQTEVDLSPVTRALTSAITRTFPLTRYQVMTTAEWLQTMVAEHLPRSVYDILYN